MRPDGRIHARLPCIILPSILVMHSDGRISGHLRAMSNHNSAIQLPSPRKRQNPVSQLLQISLHTLQGIYLLILPGRKAQLKKSGDTALSHRGIILLLKPVIVSEQVFVDRQRQIAVAILIQSVFAIIDQDCVSIFRPRPFRCDSLQNHYCITRTLKFQ